MDDRTLAQRYRRQHVECFLRSGLSQRAYCARQAGAPSRKTLGKWLRRYRTEGASGLRSRRASPCPWNRTSLDDEARILEHVKQQPGDGAQRIADELRGEISVGHNGVWGVLRRRGLSRYRERLEWARRELGQVVTRSELERARERAKRRHVEVSYPGELWGQDTFLIGRLKGIGAVYHYLAVDIASSFGIAKLYTARNAENACDFVRDHLVPKAQHLGVHALLQDNGTEYTMRRARTPDGHCRHSFHDLAAELGIELRFIRPGHAWTNGSCERLHQTLLREFYLPAMCSKIYGSVEELDYDLQLYLQRYNYRRPHRGFRLQGRKPADIYLSGITPSPKLRIQLAA